MNSFKRLLIFTLFLIFIFSNSIESLAGQCSSSQLANHAVEPHSLILHPQNHNIVFDVLHNRYWIRDIKMFTGYYEAKLQQISTLNNMPDYISPYWGTWHMSSHSNFASSMDIYCYDDAAEVFGYVYGIIDSWAYTVGTSMQDAMFSTRRIFRPEVAGDVPDPTSYYGIANFGAWTTADAIANPHLAKVKITTSRNSKWSLDGIVWHNSGDTTWAFPGTYDVIFEPVPGYSPEPLTISPMPDSFLTQSVPFYIASNVVSVNGYTLGIGDVGIGTNAPTAKLEIKTNGDVDNLFVNASSNHNYAAKISNNGGDGLGLLIKVGSVDASNAVPLSILDNASNELFKIYGNGDIIGKNRFGIEYPYSGVFDDSTSNAPYSRVHADSFHTEGLGQGQLYLEGRAIDANNTIYIGYGFAGSGNTIANNVTSFAGDVGIGTATPQYKLDVAGNIRGNNVSPSDIRWKKNVSPIEGALDKVMKLQGVSFDWRTDEFKRMGFDESRQIGFIAQDVEPVLPELVTTDRDGYKAVSYEKMTAVLVEAIKAQQKEIEALKAEIKELSKGVIK